jgi:hypothetical protein
MTQRGQFRMAFDTIAAARRGAIDILEAQQVENSLRSAGIKSGLPLARYWIAERSKQQIEHWKVRVVEGVDAPAMVDGMGLRTLNDVAQPLRRANVRMLKDRQERDRQDDRRRCLST